MHLIVADNFKSYVTLAFSVPLLTEEQEIRHFTNLQLNDDASAAEKLILPHLRLVISVARGMRGYNVSQEDLVQEGCCIVH